MFLKIKIFTKAVGKQDLIKNKKSLTLLIVRTEIHSVCFDENGKSSNANV